MRVLIVMLLAALLLATMGSLAIAQQAADTPEHAAAASGTTAVANTDWIRTVGVVGMAGVWLLRGFNSVSRRRKERKDFVADDPETDVAAEAERGPDIGDVHDPGQHPS